VAAAPAAAAAAPPPQQKPAESEPMSLAGELWLVGKGLVPGTRGGPSASAGWVAVVWGRCIGLLGMCTRWCFSVFVSL
jgi:hypothetical protein